MSPRKRVFAPTAGFTLLALLGSLAFVRLGLWQWHRGGERSAERERLLCYLEEQRAIVRREPRSAGKLFPYKVEGISMDEGAAWVGVCSVVLNLQELITRD